jgi:hypothetical protein
VTGPLSDLDDQLPGTAPAPVVLGLVAAPGTPADDELVDAARRRMLTEDWDLALRLTDVPPAWCGPTGRAAGGLQLPARPRRRPPAAELNTRLPPGRSIMGP